MRFKLACSASTTESEDWRHGWGANLVAISGRVLVSFMKSPRNSSDLPKPYTCSQRPAAVGWVLRQLDEALLA